jgi:hypothetical protein
MLAQQFLATGELESLQLVSHAIPNTTSDIE